MPRRHGPAATATLVAAALVAVCCRAQDAQYAQFDGSGNNAANPSWGRAGGGAAGAFLPTTTYWPADGSGATLPSGAGHPNARNVSNSLLSLAPFRFNAYSVAALAAAWGQFVAHDMIMTGPPEAAGLDEVVAVPVPPCDADMDPACTGTQTLTFHRNEFAAGTGTNAANARVLVNKQTAFLDGSVVYGTTVGRAALLRSGARGLLLTGADGNGLPLNPSCIPMAGPLGNSCSQRLAGDPRANVAPGILSLQALFVLEHNWWAAALGRANPTWGDEQRFQEARKRVAAEIQAVNYNEYLPILLGGPLPPYTGYNASVDPRVDTSFAAAAYRYGHSGINSLYPCIDRGMAPCMAGAALLLREAYFRPAYLGWMSIGDLLRGQVTELESGEWGGWRLVRLWISKGFFVGSNFRGWFV